MGMKPDHYDSITPATAAQVALQAATHAYEDGKTVTITLTPIAAGRVRLVVDYEEIAE